MRAAFARGYIELESPERRSGSLFLRSGRRFDNGRFHRLYRACSDAPSATEPRPTVLQRQRHRCDAPQHANRGYLSGQFRQQHGLDTRRFGGSPPLAVRVCRGRRAANARRHKNRIRRVLRRSRPTRQHFRLHKHVQLAGDRVRAVSGQPGEIVRHMHLIVIAKVMGISVHRVVGETGVDPLSWTPQRSVLWGRVYPDPDSDRWFSCPS